LSERLLLECLAWLLEYLAWLRGCLAWLLERLAWLLECLAWQRDCLECLAWLRECLAWLREYLAWLPECLASCRHPQLLWCVFNLFPSILLLTIYVAAALNFNESFCYFYELRFSFVKP
jgi:hypothetical protein